MFPPLIVLQHSMILLSDVNNYNNNISKFENRSDN